MNDDIKSRLDDELPPGATPFTLDSADAVALGRRGARRRRLAVASGGAVSALAVGGLAMALLLPGAPVGGGPNSAADGDERPVAEGGPLPDLDPDKRYSWMPPVAMETTTPNGREYDKVFWKHMEAEHPDAEADDTPPQETGETAVSNRIGINLTQRELVEWRDDTGETIHKHPMFALNSLVTYEDSSKGASTDLVAFRFDGEQLPTDVGVQVIPEEQYRIDSHDVYDLTDCVNPDERGKESCETTEAEGPNGERVQNVRVESRHDDGDLVSVTNRVVMYRQDGSAVVVSAGLSDNSAKDGDVDEPALSFDDLTALAAALPLTAIK